MSRLRLLNRHAESGAAHKRNPVPLSQDILGEARDLDSPDQCAPLDELSAQLRRVQPVVIEGDAARIAFWVNLYNALILHCLCLRPVRGSILRHRRMFAKVAYEIGGDGYSLNLIEHGLLRRNRRPPFGPRRTLRRSDPRLAGAPSRLDPRIHFALNCGARSCPPIRVYDPKQLDQQLDAAATAYLQAETELDPERLRVTLPRLMRLYRADFGGRADQLRFAGRYLPVLAAHLREAPPILHVTYGRFDWSAAAGSSAGV
jgi:hypothetical protein